MFNSAIDTSFPFDPDPATGLTTSTPRWSDRPREMTAGAIAHAVIGANQSRYCCMPADSNRSCEHRGDKLCTTPSPAVHRVGDKAVNYNISWRAPRRLTCANVVHRPVDKK